MSTSAPLLPLPWGAPRVASPPPVAAAAAAAFCTPALAPASAAALARFAAFAADRSCCRSRADCS
eukprot:163798-Chlamydomonas_euryale.AAC.1